MDYFSKCAVSICCVGTREPRGRQFVEFPLSVFGRSRMSLCHWELLLEPLPSKLRFGWMHEVGKR